MPLTDLACKNAKGRLRTYKLADTGGLYLEVTPKGNRWWRLKYRHLGKEKRLSFGVFPTITLAAAREQREAAKRQLAQGIDPSMTRMEEKQLAAVKAAQTFALVSDEWYGIHENRWSKSHADNIRLRLDNDLIPELGRYPIHALTPPLVLTCLRKIEKRSGDQAKRCIGMVSQVMLHAVQTGRVERNFIPDLRGALLPLRRKHFAAIASDQLPGLLQKLNSNENRLYRRTIIAFKMLMLTFVRTRELIEAKWTEFDLDNAGWTIPAERMKMRIEHFVPLSTQALEMLAELKRDNPQSEYVFPSLIRPQQPMSNMTILMALRRMNYDKKMTGHGFRALAMTTIKEKLRYPHEVIDRQLSHLPRSAVDRAYDRTKYLEDRTKMMQEWADYVEKLTDRA